MYEYDEECLQVFLDRQGQLFDEPVAGTLEEAEAFLEDCMAVVVDSIQEVAISRRRAWTWKACPSRSWKKHQRSLPCQAANT